MTAPTLPRRALGPSTFKRHIAAMPGAFLPVTGYPTRPELLYVRRP
jgi:hypothetical protein